MGYYWPKVGQQMYTTDDPVNWDDSHMPLSTLCQPGYPTQEVLGVWSGGEWRKPLDISEMSGR